MQQISNNGLVSVIIPVYNAEKFLARTINFVLAQTYKNFELLLVDDGSKDKSAEICQQYVEKDERVKYFYKTNGGVSSARNFGIEKATGEYIAFMDNDDGIKPDYLEVHVNNIGNCDLIVSDYVMYEDGKKIGGGNKTLHDNYDIVTATAEQKSFNKIHNRGLMFCWCKMYRRKIIMQHNIRFENIGSEDTLFNFTFMSHASSIRNINYAGYYWLRVSSSLGHTHGYYTELSFVNKLLKVIEDLAKHWGMNEAKYKEEFWGYFAWAFVRLLVKGYFPDTLVGVKTRLKRWKEVANHEYFKTIPIKKIKCLHKPIVITFIIIARLRLFYIFDPLLRIAASIFCKH